MVRLRYERLSSSVMYGLNLHIVGFHFLQIHEYTSAYKE